LNKSRNAVIVPRKRNRQLEDVEDAVEDAGKPTAAIRGRSSTRKRKREPSPDAEGEGEANMARSTSRRAASVRPSDLVGLPNVEDRVKAETQRRKKSRRLEKQHRKGEADRKIVDVKPKHLFSGKSGMGTSDWR